jgi:hypothetical protein
MRREKAFVHHPEKCSFFFFPIKSVICAASCLGFVHVPDHTSHHTYHIARTCLGFVHVPDHTSHHTYHIARTRAHHWNDDILIVNGQCGGSLSVWLALSL